MTLRERIREIAGEQGGPTALARKAGLATSTVAQYLSEEKGRASEPGVEALIKLAAAGAVSISWLAAGIGSKAPSGLPDGYIAIPFLDLGGSIYSLIRAEEPSEFVVIKQSWIDRPGVSLRDLIAVAADEAVPPSIRPGDILIVDRAPISASTPSDRQPKSWPINILSDSFYLVARGTRLVVRQLAWGMARKPGEQMPLIIRATGDSKSQTVQPAKMPAGNAMPADFQIIGRVAWRAGAPD